GLRVWNPRNHQRFHAFGDPHDARPGPENPQLPPRRGRLADADRGRRNRMVAILYTDRGEGPGAWPRNQPREHDAGRSRGDRANLRVEGQAAHCGPSVARSRAVVGSRTADDMNATRSTP